MTKPSVIRRVALVLCLAATTASAAKPHKHATQVDESGPAALRYARGTRLYDRAAWQAALVEFSNAYYLLQDPAFIFNIAQCQRQLKKYGAAAESYRLFLAEAPAADATVRAQVERLAVEMESHDGGAQ